VTGWAPPVSQPDRSVPTTKGKFLVVGTHTVFGVEPGSPVDLDLPTEAFDALVEAGHVDPSPVEAEQSAETKTEQAAQPIPVVIHVTDGDNVHAVDTNT